jgi:hypothetical protein
VAAVAVLVLPEQQDGEREPWRVQWPRVPRELRADFARVSVTAATVWATVALYLSIVPSYARGFLGTSNLAAGRGGGGRAARLVGDADPRTAVAPAPRLGQATGLGLLACGLTALAVSSPLQSLAVLLAGAAVAGAGHGLAFVSAQEELNDFAPPERRAEVTAAFIACIYFLVATSVIGVGVLDLRCSLSVSVEAVAVVLALSTLAGVAWQLRRAA